VPLTPATYRLGDGWHVRCLTPLVRRLATFLVLFSAFASAAHAQVTELMPGVGYEKIVQFTPHGPVVLHVITAPRPGADNGLYQLAPALAHGTLAGNAEPLTQIQQELAGQATVAGINGDFPRPGGIVISGGVLLRQPLQTRSSIGIDASGSLRVDRVRFAGTWKGTGQRRPLAGVNQTPGAGQVVLFTPAYGAPVPRIAGAAEVTLDPFPAALPNTDLTTAVTAVGTGGGDTIPPAGAVLLATGTAAAKLQAEVPVGAQVTTRLILQPTWDGVVGALGGGPVLVKNGRPVFRSLEDFTTDQISSRTPRAGVGQLADGRVVLVAVDGSQPGYSAGMTSFELAQTLQRLGAVTASAVESGGAVTAAFDGRLLDRPSDAAGERPVKEALLVAYYGVYSPPLLPLLNGDPTRAVEPLAYKLVRPSIVTAEVIGPDGVPRVLESAVAHPPGSYSLAFDGYDVEGAWRWHVQATDDLGRASTVDQLFRYDTTLAGVTVAAPARGSAVVRFTLARPAKVRLRIETKAGVVVRELSAAGLQAGDRQLVWDGLLPQGPRAYGGSYIAHVFATSTVGASDVAVPFTYRR
jgi:hypothetical protein